MCERIAGISIEGGYFNAPCIFTPFALVSPQGKPRYISIIYGKNGSGKTSLSQGFYEFATGAGTFDNVELIDHNGMPIDNIDEHRIFVFNESYIRKAIEFTEDGLDSIVMLGEQVELDEQIKTLELRIDVLNKEIAADMMSFNTSYETFTNPLSPEYQLNAIRENLRQNWAVRESRIKSLRQNASVREDFIFSLFQLNEQAELENIRTKFESTRVQLESAQSGVRVDDRLSKVAEDGKIESEITLVLKKKITEPVLSEREQRIMELVKESPENEQLLVRAKNIFSDHTTEICPFCLRHINADYKADLVNSISKLFDTVGATQHREELSAIKLTRFEIELHRFRTISNSCCDDIHELIDVYHQRVTLAQEKITQKLSSIYSPLACKPFGLHELQVCINQHIDLLAQARETYNKNIDSITELKSGLAILNKVYAREEVRHIYEQYQQQVNAKKSQKTLLDAKINEFKQIKQSIETLNAQKKNIHIAIEIINDYLAYIFFEKSRLQLELSDGKYIVKCRGQHVRLASLSVGERNAIALCYFLSVLCQNKQQIDIYKEKCLLILDDPVSSFDFENKIGIYSFLRYILNNLHAKNKDSRCLILTHELEATFSLMRICADISLNSKAYELKEKILVPFEDKKHNEYSFMLRKIFSYASQESGYTEYNDSIGNTMRRVLEAYGTFTYKKGIEALSCNHDILATIGDEKKQVYFNNLMYRLVLNGGSHLQEQAQGIPDTNFFTYISESEKIRTAKEILVFLKLLNQLCKYPVK